MPAFFVTGNDESGVKQFAQTLAAQIGDGLDEFGMTIIDGAVTGPGDSIARIQDAVNSLQSYPFFGGRKLVWLKNAACFSDSPSARAEGVAEALDTLCAISTALLPDSVDFILSAPCPDKRRSTFKRFSKEFKTTVVDLPSFGFNSTEQDVIRWVARQSKDFGLELDTGAVELLTARVGAVPGQLRNELEKLSVACGGEVVTERMVASLVPTTRQGNVFEMGNALSKRDPQKAVVVFQRLMGQKESPIGILLAGVMPTIRSLLLAKELIETEDIPVADSRAAMAAINRLPQDKAQHLPRKKDGTVNSYGLSLAAVDCHRYSMSELIRAFRLCVETNVKMISGKGDPEVLLQQILVEITATTA